MWSSLNICRDVVSKSDCVVDAGAVFLIWSDDLHGLKVCRVSRIFRHILERGCSRREHEIPSLSRIFIDSYFD